MKKNIYKAVFLFSSLFITQQSINAQCHIDDWTALKALYESTDGDNWTNNTNWQEVTGALPSANCNLENLYGVELDAQGRVDDLDLYNNELIGSIPSELENLTSLTYLDFDFNQLSGSIPYQLSNLSNLTFLSLYSNQLVGSIPNQLGNLSNLEELALSGNQLSGSIPNQLGNLSNLNRLYLSSNRLSGSIPTQLGNLSNLNWLKLSENELSGSIPHQLGNLSNLNRLYLSSNRLSGSIPTQLGNLSNLEYLSFGNNKLSGSIPHELGNLSNLEALGLQNNEFVGSIPPELGNLSNLEHFGLDNNELSGSIPPELGNLSNLEYFGFGGNQLGGGIPPELGNLSNLRFLYLSNNELSGSIPSELGNLSNLEQLSLWSNQLIGSIPPELGNLSNLSGLSLDNNQFSGNIPPELGNLSNLTTLGLGNNQLSGSIPPQMGQLGYLSNFYWLFLDNNELSGSIPPELGNLSSLQRLRINDNDLSGCYSDNLAILCTQLASSFHGDPDLSVGNNFDANWEEFCAAGAGACEPPNNSITNVWPGDLNYDGICNNQDFSISHLFIGESGPYRSPANIDWIAQTCENWGITQPNGYDIKHHDCNGDGYIGTNDANAIILNNGKTHPLPPGIVSPTATVYTNTDFQILLQPINQVSPNSNIVIMDIVMDSKSGQNLEVFGGHFSIDYSNIIDNVDNAVMNFESLSWLGNPGVDFLAESWQNTFENTIEVGFTKTNGLSSIGKGVIGKVTFLLNTANLNRNNACESLFDVAITKIGSFNAQQDTLQIEEEFRTINLGISCCEPFINIDDETPFQNLYQSSSAIATNGYLPIGESQQVQYNANRVTLNAGFSVRAGADFKVRSSGCN